MSELQSYLKTKLNDFSKTDNVLYRLNAYCESDRELKRQWKRDHEEIRNQWQGVSSVAAIQEYMRGYAATIERYKRYIISCESSNSYAKPAKISFS